MLLFDAFLKCRVLAAQLVDAPLQLPRRRLAIVRGVPTRPLAAGLVSVFRFSLPVRRSAAVFPLCVVIVDDGAEPRLAPPWVAPSQDTVRRACNGRK